MHTTSTRHCRTAGSCGLFLYLCNCRRVPVIRATRTVKALHSTLHIFTNGFFVTVLWGKFQAFEAGLGFINLYLFADRNRRRGAVVCETQQCSQACEMQVVHFKRSEWGRGGEGKW